MKRPITLALATLAAHSAAAAFVGPYRDVLFGFGSYVKRGTDIADLPAQLLIGFVGIGALLVVLALLLRTVLRALRGVT